MADFCLQCARDKLGMENGVNDLNGITTEEDTKKGVYAAVLCEGCGNVLVDHTGKCVGGFCWEKHSKNEKAGTSK